MNKQQILKDVDKGIAKYFNPAKIQARVYDDGDTIRIEPDTRGRKDLEGLQILIFLTEDIAEFSEYQAGPNQNELHVFGEYKTVDSCFKKFMKGKCKPKKIWT